MEKMGATSGAMPWFYSYSLASLLDSLVASAMGRNHLAISMLLLSEMGKGPMVIKNS